MGNIHVLDKLVADMIAAGEVVERPASVVKELVENAIDAGADYITIEIRNGGVQYIRVSDNGSGILRDDVKTAFLRHATSKIRTSQDLSEIYTLGFRGEALSSIAAVAKIELLTKTAQETVGTRAVLEAGDILRCEDAGCPNGTTVVVRDLFYNIPARQKFLKRDQTEAAYVADMVDKLVLSHPEISFRFLNNGKESLFSLGDGNLAGCISTVFGKEYAKQMLPVQYSYEGVEVSGLCGNTHITRPNRAFQCFFINGRYVRGKLFHMSIEEAYAELLNKGRFPVCVLKLNLDANQVDINVHPTKLEAKFSDEQKISRCIYFAVKEALKGRERAFAVNTAPKNVLKYSSTYTQALPEYEQNTIANHLPDRQTKTAAKAADAKPVRKYAVNVPPLRKAEQATSGKVSVPGQPNAADEASKYPLPCETEHSSKLETMQARQYTSDSSGSYSSLFEPGALGVQIINKAPAESVQAQKLPLEKPYRIIGQLFDTYILLEQENELLLIDQHAAHERQRYDTLTQMINSKSPLGQMLLSPVVVTLSKAEKDKALEYTSFFQEFGFEIEEFGNDEIIIRSTPVLYGEDELRSVFVELIDKLRTIRSKEITDVLRENICQTACKGAVKGHQKLEKQEMEEICSYVLKLTDKTTCPHGRPIMLSFSQYFIEKQFKRV